MNVIERKESWEEAVPVSELMPSKELRDKLRHWPGSGKGADRYSPSLLPFHVHVPFWANSSEYTLALSLASRPTTWD